MNHKQHNRRSIIFYSALEPERWEDGIASGADMFCLDMEDSTSADRKEEARQVCLPLYRRQVERPVRRLVRMNIPRSDQGVRDMLAIAALDTPPDGVVIPKVTSAAEVQWVAGILAPKHPNLELIVLIEDQKGFENIREIAKAAPQISTIFLGSADFSGEIGSDLSLDALHHLRSRMVLAASEAGIDSLDGCFFDPTDIDGLIAETQCVADMGFAGKASYDAVQIPHIHNIFTPDANSIDHARRVVTAITNSPTGQARVDGISVNRANLKSANRIIETAERRGVL
ncbi:MAG: HpcH/HpaI aldolase/citrate lyase family protein [Alphaproteobacteria bacterium]